MASVSAENSFGAKQGPKGECPVCLCSPFLLDYQQVLSQVDWHRSVNLVNVKLGQEAPLAEALGHCHHLIYRRRGNCAQGFDIALFTL